MGFKTSCGRTLTKQQINVKTRIAKDEYTEMFLAAYGFCFCEHCGKPAGTAKFMSRSHIISVNTAQNTGRAELCYNLHNLELLCLGCHEEIENLGNQLREKWFMFHKAGQNWKVFKREYVESNV